LFSGSALGEANRQITEAKRQQSLMSAISGEAQDRFNIASSMSAINANRRAMMLNGGYNQSSIRAAKAGMKLKSIMDKYHQKLKGGGIITPEPIIESSIVKELEPPTLIKELELPSFVKELELPTFVKELDVFKEGGKVEEPEESSINADKIIKFVNKHKKVNFV
jgi:hypothetical protein